MVKYVTVNKLSEMTGYTKDAIRAKIKKGQWIRGKHWFKSPDGRVQLKPTAIEQWIEGR